MQRSLLLLSASFLLVACEGLNSPWSSTSAPEGKTIATVAPTAQAAANGVEGAPVTNARYSWEKDLPAGETAKPVVATSSSHLAFRWAPDTFASLPRPKPRNETAARRAKSPLHVYALGIDFRRFAGLDSSTPPPFYTLFTSQLFIGVINVYHCRRSGKRACFRVPEKRKSVKQRAIVAFHVEGHDNPLPRFMAA